MAIKNRITDILECSASSAIQIIISLDWEVGLLGQNIWIFLKDFLFILLNFLKD